MTMVAEPPIGLVADEMPTLSAMKSHRMKTRIGDWDKIRSAFVSRPQRPTFPELSSEFAVPLSAIQAASVDEGWPILRSQSLSEQLKDAGASEIVLEALKASRAIVSTGENVGLTLLQCIARQVAELESDTKMPARAKANIANTLSFAAKNTADSMKALGIVGFAKALGEGKEENGKWKPELLQQINITLGDLARKGEAEISVGADSVI